MSYQVYVENIHPNATVDQVVGFFAQAGPVVSFRLVCDPGTKKSRGFGYCDYRDAAGALAAIRDLNGRELLGQPLRVVPAPAAK